MGGHGRRQGGVHKNIKAAVHADKKKTALAEAFAQSGPEEFLMEFFNRQQLRHYPVGDEAQNPFGRFECTLCGDALLLPTPNRPQIVHLCKQVSAPSPSCPAAATAVAGAADGAADGAVMSCAQMGKLDLGVMRRVDMLTAEGACIMCHNIPKNSPHDCPARPMNTTMFDFTCFFDLPRPLPAGISSLDKLAVARNKLKDLALHCLLQGLVTFVMPAVSLAATLLRVVWDTC